MTDTDNCPTCNQNHDDDDDRTPEQIASDVAATTLQRLDHISEEHHYLQHQLDNLAEWADDHDLGDDHGHYAALLGDAAAYLRFGNPVYELLANYVRDIAATLPIRGIEYGDETTP
jgi:hypothetical protein